MQGSYHLYRFLRAQEFTYADVLEEIKNGKKQSGWMWFIFPQIQGLGLSREAQYYGLKDLEETRQYLVHPILGSRLVELASALMKIKGPPEHTETKVESKAYTGFSMESV